MSRYIEFIVVALLFVTLSHRAEAAALIEKGKPLGRIVLPAAPSKAETFAAEELQTLLQQMSGATLEIVATDDVNDAPAIVVGRHRASGDLLQALQAKYPGRIEAIAVVARGNRVHVLGGCSTATIWAAWEWLETLGVRFLMPGQHGTYLPRLDTIDIMPAECFDAPAMDYRSAAYWLSAEYGAAQDYEAIEHGMPAWRIYSLRMRFNMNLGFEPADEVVIAGGGHSYANHLPVERYFDQHPEWFNLIGGKRQKSGLWQVCFTNEQAADEYAKNVLAELDRVLKAGCRIERTRMFVSPNDGRAWCECDNCQKLADADGSSTSMVTHFANMIAERVRKVHPQVRIVFYAYSNHSTTPDHVRPGPGVVPEVAFWTDSISFSANHAKPMFSDGNAKYRDHFRKLSEMSDSIAARTYYGHYTWFTPWPYVTQMANDIPIMAADPKFEGMYSETHLHWSTQGLTFYLHPKMMWNPSLNVPAAIADYCRAAFGPAAGQMQHYFATLQKQMDSLGYICGYTPEIPQLLTPEVVEKANRHIDAAERYLGEMDASMRWRSELVIAGWRNSVKFARACDLFVNSSKPSDRDVILSLCEEVETFCGSEQGRWAFEHRVAMPAIDQIRGNLRADPVDLPPGEFLYDDNCMYGGATKFFATTTNMPSSLWGLSISENKVGTLVFPLQARSGHYIEKIKVKFLFSGTEKEIDASCELIGPDEKPLADLGENVAMLSAGVEAALPAGAAGRYAIRLTARSKSADARRVLAGVRVEAQVQ